MDSKKAIDAQPANSNDALKRMMKEADDINEIIYEQDQIDKNKESVVCKSTVRCAQHANPQSFVYFMFLYAMAGIVTFELGAVGPLLRQNPSLFKDHGGVFMLMTIVSGFVAVLASVILILASLLLQSWMKDIRYTILKTIGSFSAIVVPFSLGAVVFVPSGDLNWIAYTVLGVIFSGFLYLYSCIWKVACVFHQENHFNSYPVHWSLLLALLLPILSNFVLVFRGNTHWAVSCFNFTIRVLPTVALVYYCFHELYRRIQRTSLTKQDDWQLQKLAIKDD
ncbi:hypothetical protein Tco_0672449 [Tanacetum coccineum]